jgi:hypothetical protein
MTQETPIRKGDDGNTDNSQSEVSISLEFLSV